MADSLVDLKKDNIFFSINIKTIIGSILFDIMLNEAFFVPNKDFASGLHNHAFYQLHFISSGKGLLLVDDKSYELYPNSYCIIAPGMYHEQKVDPIDPIHKYCVRFNFRYLKALGNYLDDYSKKEDKTILDMLLKIRCHFSKDNYDCLSIIHDIHNELAGQRIGFYVRIQSLFALLFINVIRNMYPESKMIYKIPKNMSQCDDNIIDDFFEKNYWKDVKAVDLASRIFMSEKQLHSILNKLYNTTFKRKLMVTRIEISKNLLRNTNLLINIIPEKVGYSKVSNFISAFKQITGLTPKSYRNLFLDHK